MEKGSTVVQYHKILTILYSTEALEAAGRPCSVLGAWARNYCAAQQAASSLSRPPPLVVEAVSSHRWTSMKHFPRHHRTHLTRHTVCSVLLCTETAATTVPHLCCRRYGLAEMPSRNSNSRFTMPILKRCRPTAGAHLTMHATARPMG